MVISKEKLPIKERIFNFFRDCKYLTTVYFYQESLEDRESCINKARKQGFVVERIIMNEGETVAIRVYILN